MTFQMLEFKLFFRGNSSKEKSKRTDVEKSEMYFKNSKLDTVCLKERNSNGEDWETHRNNLVNVLGQWIAAKMGSCWKFKKSHVINCLILMYT